jgi:hypothetical protein
VLEGLPDVSLKKSARHASFLHRQESFRFQRPTCLCSDLKLPKERIEKLVTEERASFLVMGKRTMHEWALVERKDTSEDTIKLALIKESIEFVLPTPERKRI